MGFSGTRMTGFNWAFFLRRLEENSSAQQQKEGQTRTRATLSVYEIEGEYLTKYFHDLFKELKHRDLVLCNRTDHEVDRSHFRVGGGGNSSEAEMPRFLHNKMIFWKDD